MAHRFDNHGNMEMNTAQAADKLAALAQETRLSIFRLLVAAGPQGMNAGAIAAALDIPAATLSFHVSQLARAGLAEARQEGRFVFYAAGYAAMDELIAFLTDNCCQGGQCLPKTAAASTSAKRRARAGATS
jgi:DNA-binding transcriptional ArsR family regulator